MLADASLDGIVQTRSTNDVVVTETSSGTFVGANFSFAKFTEEADATHTSVVETLPVLSTLLVASQHSTVRSSMLRVTFTVMTKWIFDAFTVKVAVSGRAHTFQTVGTGPSRVTKTSIFLVWIPCV